MWEYHVIEMPPDRSSPDVNITLNAFGEKRWEFVAAYVTSAGYNAFVFKRPKQAEVGEQTAGFKIKLEE